MRFNENVPKKYRKSINRAFETILKKGTARNKRTAQMILDSELLICAGPVKEVVASGITGLIDPSATQQKIADGRMTLTEALGEVFITIAFETMNTDQGTEGTLVHEGEHAVDFAKTIESFSTAATNPLSIYDPSHYEMEWTAHVVSAEYLIQISLESYLQEGLGLGLVGQSEKGYFVDKEGIKSRLRNSYGMEQGGNTGPLASQMGGISIG